MNQSWQSTVIALGFIAFAGLALWVAADHDFATIWSGVGTIIGVLPAPSPRTSSNNKPITKPGRRTPSRVHCRHRLIKN